MGCLWHGGSPKKGVHGTPPALLGAALGSVVPAVLLGVLWGPYPPPVPTQREARPGCSCTNATRELYSQPDTKLYFSRNFSFCSSDEGGTTRRGAGWGGQDRDTPPLAVGGTHIGPHGTIPASSPCPLCCGAGGCGAGSGVGGQRAAQTASYRAGRALEAMGRGHGVGGAEETRGKGGSGGRHCGSAFRMAFTSSATAVSANSNWSLVCTMPGRWSRMCSSVAAMSISFTPLAMRFRTMSTRM